MTFKKTAIKGVLPDPEGTVKGVTPEDLVGGSQARLRVFLRVFPIVHKFAFMDPNRGPNKALNKK